MSSRPTDVAEMPQKDAYYCEVPRDPCVIVLFGASGDLAHRKLLPALFDLARHDCLAPRFRLLGFARTHMSDDDFRRGADEDLPKGDGAGAGAQDACRENFIKQLEYFTGNYDDPESYRRLAQRLEALDGEAQLAGNRLYYLATPPDVYPHIIEQLGKAGQGEVRKIVDAHHYRKAVRPRRRFRAGFEPEGAGRLRGIAGLSH
jgi:glucose-6-phosphate 1-dehydrogenase